MNNNSVRFLHFRNVWEINDFDFDFMNASDLVDGKGGATVAYRREPNGSFSYAIALCSDRDNFNRRIGRDISLGRLVKGPAVVVPEQSLDQWQESAGSTDIAFEFYMDELMGDRFGLSRVRRSKRKNKQKVCDNQAECCCDCG